MARMGHHRQQSVYYVSELSVWKHSSKTQTTDRRPRKRRLRKHRPRKRRPRKHRPWKRCLCTILIEKLRPFTPNGTKKFKSPKLSSGLHGLTLAEISKMADALRISDSVYFSDCKCSFRLQKIELKITWNFIKLGIPIQYKIKQWK